MLRQDLRPCGCRTVFSEEMVLSVGTCPRCLPPGAITWLIDNGRQLELLLEGGVTQGVRSADTDEPQVTSPEGLLPF